LSTPIALALKSKCPDKTYTNEKSKGAPYNGGYVRLLLYYNVNHLNVGIEGGEHILNSLLSWRAMISTTIFKFYSVFEKIIKSARQMLIVTGPSGRDLLFGV
jgi:hypothetical protein